MTSVPGGGETTGATREGGIECMEAEVTRAGQSCSADHEFDVHRLVLSDLIVLMYWSAEAIREA